MRPPGEKNIDDIISSTECGVLIKKFAAPYVDFVTGNFGLEIRNAVLIENGERKEPIKHALLVGNIYKAINNIVDIGREQKMIGTILLPAIRFSELQIIGL